MYKTDVKYSLILISLYNIFNSLNFCLVQHVFHHGAFCMIRGVIMTKEFYLKKPKQSVIDKAQVALLT